MKILCLGIGFGYVFYMCNGFLASTPSKKPYNALFDAKMYLAHLGGAIALAAFGFWYFRNAGLQMASYLVPAVFLVGFLIGDKLVRSMTGRHLIIADRWDKKPPSYKWYIDGLVSILLITISLCSPFVLVTWL